MFQLKVVVASAVLMGIYSLPDPDRAPRFNDFEHLARIQEWTALDDAEAAPGVENIVFVAPAAGSYRVYAHYYDEAGAGPALARVTLTLNDGSFPVLDDTRTLQAGCALWHVGDVEYPGGLVSNTAAGISSLCP